MAQMTNEEFGDRVDCHYSMASRLKWGQRMPGRELFGRIVREFNLDPAKALEALNAGPVVFSSYLRKNVFEPSGEESPVSSSDGS